MARKIESRMIASRAVRGVPGAMEHSLELGLAGEKTRIPATLLLPPAGVSAPAALLLHGYSSRKEHMSEGAGRALLAEGIASLAIDLPMHGERDDPVQRQATRNPLELMRRWREGLEECSLSLRYLAARPDVDGEKLAIVGYSLGSFVGIVVAARESSVKAVVLAAGGDLPSRTPLAAIARRVADPIKAVRQLDGRPLLMVNGKRDRTVSPDQAQRLFGAASEPKELRWWDGGHILPAAAARDAAAWLAARLSSAGKSAPRRRRSG